MALFFACRSCKYTAAAIIRKIKTISLGNIRFNTEQAGEINHADPSLANAPYVFITFIDQKKNKKIETVTMLATEDSVINLVR